MVVNELVRCMIVDDEPLALELINSHISHIPQLEVIATATNPIDAIKLLKSESIDLLFIDIQMPVLTGLEVVRTLQNSPAVIFTTAYRDYAVESYELNVVDYIMKPITLVRFIKAVNKYLDQRGLDPHINSLNNNPEKVQSYIYVNVNKRYVKVTFDEIRYIESVKDYIRIHTITDTVNTKEKISNFENKLPSSFMRIHRSFIVNKSLITAFTSHDIEIGEKEIPIGASYKEAVMEVLK